MQRLTLTLVGTSPLVCHNIRLADPDDPFTRDISAITSKRKKTEDDRLAISRIEFLGGLYTFPGILGPAMPTANVKRCLNQAAKIKRQGRDVLRALYPEALAVPIAYEGPRDLEKLADTPAFVYRTAVGVGMKRVMRTRPSFAEWALTLDCQFEPAVMDLDQLIEVGHLAGLAEGIGDNRVNGYGRFTFSAQVQ